MLNATPLAARSLLPSIQVIGAEPAGADDAARSFHSGERQPQLAPDTIADGLRTSLGRLNFQIIREQVDDILTVHDADILRAMRLIWTRMKLVVEPSAAVGLAVVMTHRANFVDQSVVIVLSGGNVDLDHLPWEQRAP